MPTNKQRREAARRHLERQLERRQEREARRRRTNLIFSIVGTVVLVAAIVVAIVVIGHSDKKNSTADKPTVSSPTATPSATAATSSAVPSSSAPPATGPSVTFDGVTVKGAADLAGVPGLTAKSSATPAKLAYKDLVVGKGAAAKQTSSVTVQYVGAIYKNGKIFDSSWKRGQAATFTLANTVPGYKEGIGGTTGVPAMKIGGRRIIIMPSALAYGTSGNPDAGIAGNTPLVFVVDLKAVSTATSG